MKLPADYQPEFESLKGLLLEMARERSVNGFLKMIVQRLAERPHGALVRIWLIRPGDICASCPMRAECPDQTSCLHLVASAVRPIAETEADWSHIDGDFRRFPLGVRKIGRNATSGEPAAVVDIEKDFSWIARPEWARREEIRGFGGQPLIYQGDVLGVIAVFTRIRLVQKGLVWLRMIADHAATAIINARAFEEIEQLRNQLELENVYLREEVREAKAFGEVVGGSPAIRSVLRQIKLVAPTDASVLILGESGTGKELVAREIHKQSQRRGKPMIQVNCASIPRELYESEFFGHVKGSFTGAVKDRAGRFEAADQGTLFLDEVGEIPLELQSKLLRVLQEKQYERVGDEKTRQVDVRIIAATNRELKREVEAGRFRQDLYYRLNVFPIEVAPLRRREQDIPVLAAHFLELAAKKFNRPARRLTQANLLELQRYEWPGNVRELQNVIERAVITSGPEGLRLNLPQDKAGEQPSLATPRSTRPPQDLEILPEVEMRRRERENTLNGLQRTGWRIYGPGGAAELLGMKPTTLASRIKKMGLKKQP